MKSVFERWMAKNPDIVRKILELARDKKRYPSWIRVSELYELVKDMSDMDPRIFRGQISRVLKLYPVEFPEWSSKNSNSDRTFGRGPE